MVNFFLIILNFLANFNEDQINTIDQITSLVDLKSIKPSEIIDSTLVDGFNKKINTLLLDYID